MRTLLYNKRSFVLTFFITLFVVMFARPVAAQDKKIDYLNINEPAPFAGVLLTPAAFAELKIKSDLMEEEIASKIKFAVSFATLERDLEISNLKTSAKWSEKTFAARLNLRDSQIDDLYEDLEKERRITVWDRLRNPTHIAIGVGLSLGVFVIQSNIVKRTATPSQ